MQLTNSDIYLFRSLLLGKIAQLEKTKTYAKKMPDAKDVLNKKDILFKNKLINFIQYQRVIENMANQLNHACIALKLNVTNPQIDPLVKRYEDKLNPKQKYDKILTLDKDELELYLEQVDFYIKTYEFWKNQVVSAEDWLRQEANFENAFGLKLTSEEVLVLARKKKLELTANLANI